jgi:hypothetical protein
MKNNINDLMIKYAKRCNELRSNAELHRVHRRYALANECQDREDELKKVIHDLKELL